MSGFIILWLEKVNILKLIIIVFVNYECYILEVGVKILYSCIDFKFVCSDKEN